jgi:hypothetical protein
MHETPIVNAEIAHAFHVHGVTPRHEIHRTVRSWTMRCHRSRQQPGVWWQKCRRHRRADQHQRGRGLGGAPERQTATASALRHEIDCDDLGRAPEQQIATTSALRRVKSIVTTVLNTTAALHGAATLSPAIRDTQHGRLHTPKSHHTQVRRDERAKVPWELFWLTTLLPTGAL